VFESQIAHAIAPCSGRDAVLIIVQLHAAGSREHAADRRGAAGGGKLLSADLVRHNCSKHSQQPRC